MIKSVKKIILLSFIFLINCTGSDKKPEIIHSDFNHNFKLLNNIKGPVKKIETSTYTASYRFGTIQKSNSLQVGKTQANMFFGVYSNENYVDQVFSDIYKKEIINNSIIEFNEKGKISLIKPTFYLNRLKEMGLKKFPSEDQYTVRNSFITSVSFNYNKNF
jgi:hypothetical protein